MKQFKTHTEIDNNCALTPWQKDLEHIILTKSLSSDFADTLRILASFKHEMESAQHYQHTHYRTRLIEKANSLFQRLS